MKKETKVLVIKMVNAWNQFNPQKSVDTEFEENEFNKGSWSLNIKFSGIVLSDFIAFLLPALMANNCIWFISAIDDKVILHIQ